MVLLTKAIELAGGQAGYHVPHRLKDGYGMRPEVVEAAAGQGVKLIVSVDTGIRAAEVVRRANELGIDVIVTDHHLPETELPPALAVLNPNRPDCPYLEKNLCGAGVAFKLIQALLPHIGWPADKVRRVSRIVPQAGGDRDRGRRGAADGRESHHRDARLARAAARCAMWDCARCSMWPASPNDAAPPNARQVAFQIAPRMNAAGRMDTARAVVELFLTSDAERARELAKQLHEQNTERQSVEAEIRETCEQIAVDGAESALVYYAEDWHRGVLGIVASRLVERLHRPVFVLSRNPEDGLAQGSGRSIPAFHLLEALESMADLFVKFGGHEHAAGVTLEAARVDEFRERFNAYRGGATECRGFPAAPGDRRGAGAARRSTSARSRSCSRWRHSVMAIRRRCSPRSNVEVAGPPVWKEKHLKLMVRQNGRTLSLKAWNFAPRAAELTPGARVDLAFQLEEDAYSAARGYPRWAAILRDFRPAAALSRAKSPPSNSPPGKVVQLAAGCHRQSRSASMPACVLLSFHAPKFGTPRA